MQGSKSQQSNQMPQRIMEPVHGVPSRIKPKIISGGKPRSIGIAHNPSDNKFHLRLVLDKVNVAKELDNLKRRAKEVKIHLGQVIRHSTIVQSQDPSVILREAIAAKGSSQEDDDLTLGQNAAEPFARLTESNNNAGGFCGLAGSKMMAKTGYLSRAPAKTGGSGPSLYSDMISCSYCGIINTRSFIWVHICTEHSGAT